MVNSLQRLFTEIIDTLDRAGQGVTDPYARSQVVAVIDILTNLAHRVEWKRADLQASVDELRALFAAVAALLQGQASCPATLVALREQLMAAVSTPLDEDLFAERERLSLLLIVTMREIAAGRTQMSATTADTIDQQCNAYLRRQLDRDVALVRRPLFRRISQA
ncbi:MAG: hypothetical protein ACRERD_14370 [Candidatus Binatia bacterium]